jgi:SMODS and SLOG-associating 2TM effector domain 1/SLOG in TRPM, prokaryote/Protein of unknown function (DUF4231)
MNEVLDKTSPGQRNGLPIVAAAPAADSLSQLGITPPKLVIVLLGGVESLDAAQNKRLATLCYRGVATAAMHTGALVIDTGLQPAVAASIGQSVATQASDAKLLSVTPGDEIVVLDEVARKLVPQRQGAVALLAGGGPAVQTAALACVQRGWGLIVLEGTGGMADQIVALKRKAGAVDCEPILEDIAARGNTVVFPSDARPDRLERLILQQLGRDDSLTLAWRAFAELDHNAVQERRWFERLELVLLTLAVSAVVLGLAQATLSTPAATLIPRGVIVVVPILTTIVFALANRLKNGPRWILLRGGAEAIKSQIYGYRARAREYAGADREKRLAREVSSILTHLAHTEVKERALQSYSGDIPPPSVLQADDDGTSVLSPQSYLEVRLRQQQLFYRAKATGMDRKLRVLLFFSLALGGIATYLAAVGLEPWIAVTTALVSSITAYLSYQQLEFTLSRYMQSALSLSTIDTWWTALSPAERSDPRNVYKLINSTEEILESEMTGWVQQMRDALAQLHDDGQDHKGDNSESDDDNKSNT